MNGKSEMKRFLIRLFSIYFHFALIHIYTNLVMPTLDGRGEERHDI